MVAAFDSLGINVPEYTANIGQWLMYIGIGLAILIIFGILLYWLYVIKSYNRTIVLFGLVNSRPTMLGQDRAKFERIGLAGDYWVVTRKIKKILPRPRIEIAKMTYWYWQREDGEWINFTIQDIDEKQKKANVYYIDEDMRLQRLGIQRNLKERFDVKSIWDKWGNTIMLIVTFLILTICLVIIFNKLTELVNALPELAGSLNEIAKTLRDILIQTRGGAIPVNESISAIL